MDPIVVTAALSAFVGAAIAGIFAILGGSLQTGRDHDRWVREARYSAYAEFLIAIDLWHEASTTDWIEAYFGDGDDLTAHQRLLLPITTELKRTQSRVVLIGPDAVRITAEQYQLEVARRAEIAQSIRSAEDISKFEPLLNMEALQAHRALMLGIMNRAIGIGPRRHFQPKFRRVE